MSGVVQQQGFPIYPGGYPNPNPQSQTHPQHQPQPSPSAPGPYSQPPQHLSLRSQPTPPVIIPSHLSSNQPFSAGPLSAGPGPSPGQANFPLYTQQPHPLAGPTSATPLQRPHEQTNGHAHAPPLHGFVIPAYAQAANMPYPMQGVAGPSFVPPQPYLQPGLQGMMGEYHFGAVSQDGWQGEWDDEAGEYRDGGDLMYGNVEVKHRRRTTPEQLKVLEHWFDINPKPDNNLREWLAQELGMTKRNVQVWFQNRRAKVKGLALKEKAAVEKAARDADPITTPERPTSSSGPHTDSPSGQTLLSPPVATNLNMGRRVSLANGEAAKIEMWVAKRAAAGVKQLRPPMSFSPNRSPVMGQAAAARRSSIPYPAPLLTQLEMSPGLASPKMMASVRPMPSQLHLAAIRNNTRRASMPGAAAQLISSGPFTPPRVMSGAHPMPGAVNTRNGRELSPIKDHDAEGDIRPTFAFGETDFATTYVTPPSSTYLPSAYVGADGSSLYDMFDGTDGASGSAPFAPNAPLPNPTFSFGAPTPADPGAQMLSEDEAARAQAQFMQMQQRGRIGSMASINTFTTDGGTTENEDGPSEWMSGQLAPEGFHPDARRASAPADLLHNLNFLGLTSASGPGMPMRPSPLGNHFTSEVYVDPSLPLSAAPSLIPNYTSGTSDTSPIATIAGTASVPSSEGPSPSAPGPQNHHHHQQAYAIGPGATSVPLMAANTTIPTAPSSMPPSHPPPPMRAHTMHFPTTNAAVYAEPFANNGAGPGSGAGGEVNDASATSTSAPPSETMSHILPPGLGYSTGLTPQLEQFGDKDDYAFFADGTDTVNILV